MDTCFYKHILTQYCPDYKVAIIIRYVFCSCFLLPCYWTIWYWVSSKVSDFYPQTCNSKLVFITLRTCIKILASFVSISYYSLTRVVQMCLCIYLQKLTFCIAFVYVGVCMRFLLSKVASPKIFLLCVSLCRKAQTCDIKTS